MTDDSIRVSELGSPSSNRRPDLDPREGIQGRLPLGRVQDVSFRKLRGHWIGSGSDTRCRGGQVVVRSPQLDLLAKKQPEGARSLKGHANAPGVDDACASNPPIELHVRVAADDDVCPHAVEERTEYFLRGALGEDLRVTPRRRMTEEHGA
jgi:hypothetical protein